MWEAVNHANGKRLIMRSRRRIQKLLLKVIHSQLFRRLMKILFQVSLIGNLIEDIKDLTFQMDIILF